MDTQRLQKVLDEKGLNHKEMAKVCKIPESTVSRMFSGKRRINLDTCNKVRNGLKLDANTAFSIFFK